jgi:hypothetical protein
MEAMRRSLRVREYPHLPVTIELVIDIAANVNNSSHTGQFIVVLTLLQAMRFFIPSENTRMYSQGEKRIWANIFCALV